MTVTGEATVALTMARRERDGCLYQILVLKRQKVDSNRRR